MAGTPRVKDRVGDDEQACGEPFRMMHQSVYVKRIASIKPSSGDDPHSNDKDVFADRKNMIYPHADTKEENDAIHRKEIQQCYSLNATMATSDECPRVHREQARSGEAVETQVKVDACVVTNTTTKSTFTTCIKSEGGTCSQRVFEDHEDTLCIGVAAVCTCIGVILLLALQGAPGWEPYGGSQSVLAMEEKKDRGLYVELYVMCLVAAGITFYTGLAVAKNHSKLSRESASTSYVAGWALCYIGTFRGENGREERRTEGGGATKRGVQ